MKFDLQTFERQLFDRRKFDRLTSIHLRGHFLRLHPSISTVEKPEGSFLIYDDAIGSFPKKIPNAPKSGAKRSFLTTT